jgi:hypothetical protein
MAAVAYIFLGIGFALGFACCAVLTMAKRADRCDG